MSDAEELIGEVSGFSCISTERYEGFTDRTIDNLYRIAVGLEQSDRYKAVDKILKDIYKHLDGEYPHRFNLSATDVIDQLYGTYRELGYDKDKNQFLKDVIKNIEIASTDEVASGVIYDKAVSADEWYRYWTDHLKSLGAHINIRDTISPNKCVNRYPVLHYDHTSQRYMNLTCPMEDTWNTVGMTVVFRVTNEVGEIFRISFAGGDLVVANDSITACSLKYNNVVLCSISHADLEKYTYVLVFTPEEVVIRNELQRIIIKDSDINNKGISDGNGRVSNLFSNASVLQFTDIIRSPKGRLSEFYMYNFPVRSDEEIFFIN